MARTQKIAISALCVCMCVYSADVGVVSGVHDCGYKISYKLYVQRCTQSNILKVQSAQGEGCPCKSPTKIDLSFSTSIFSHNATKWFITITVWVSCSSIESKLKNLAKNRCNRFHHSIYIVLIILTEIIHSAGVYCNLITILIKTCFSVNILGDNTAHDQYLQGMYTLAGDATLSNTILLSLSIGQCCKFLPFIGVDPFSEGNQLIGKQKGCDQVCSL